MPKQLFMALFALLILIACSDPAPTAVVPPTETPLPEATAPSDNQPVLTQPAGPNRRAYSSNDPAADGDPHNGTRTPHRDPGTRTDDNHRAYAHRDAGAGTHSHYGPHNDAYGHYGPRTDPNTDTGGNRSAHPNTHPNSHDHPESHSHNCAYAAACATLGLVARDHRSARVQVLALRLRRIPLFAVS